MNCVHVFLKTGWDQRVLMLLFGYDRRTGGNLRRSLVQPCPRSRVSSGITPGRSGLSLVKTSKDTGFTGALSPRDTARVLSVK